MKKLNKEYKLNVSNHIVLKYGSTNKENPQIVYVLGKAWIKPNFDGEYEHIIDNVKKRFKIDIKRNILKSEYFDDRFVIDLDFNPVNMKNGKKKFISFDLYLKQNTNNVKKLTELKETLSYEMGNIANNLVYDFNNNSFVVTKSKK